MIVPDIWRTVILINEYSGNDSMSIPAVRIYIRIHIHTIMQIIKYERILVHVEGKCMQSCLSLQLHVHQRPTKWVMTTKNSMQVER